MDLKLHLLETFNARGSDGAEYKVCAYERLAPNPSLAPTGDHWESTGVHEYRLQDGRAVDIAAGGQLRIHGTSIDLKDERAAA